MKNAHTWPLFHLIFSIFSNINIIFQQTNVKNLTSSIQQPGKSSLFLRPV